MSAYLSAVRGKNVSLEKKTDAQNTAGGLHHYLIWGRSYFTPEEQQYLASFMWDSLITCCFFVFFQSLLDGVFGRCQQLAGADLHTYDISASALQRLRIILQKLAQRGANRLSVFARVSFCSDQHQLCAGLPANAIVWGKPNKPSCLFGWHSTPAPS